jgi:hypothetical protein
MKMAMPASGEHIHIHSTLNQNIVFVLQSIRAARWYSPGAIPRPRFRDGGSARRESAKTDDNFPRRFSHYRRAGKYRRPAANLEREQRKSAEPHRPPAVHPHAGVLCSVAGSKGDGLRNAQDRGEAATEIPGGWPAAFRDRFNVLDGVE